MLEQRGASLPRKSRKAVRTVLDSVERLADTVDAEWCDRAAQSYREDLERTCALLSSVQQGISDDVDIEELSATVFELAASLDRCGSAALQCPAVLQNSSAGKCLHQKHERHARVELRMIT